MPADGKAKEEVQRLFAELDQAYRRAAETAQSGRPTDPSNRGKLVDDSEKALAIIKRIREIDRL